MLTRIPALALATALAFAQVPPRQEPPRRERSQEGPRRERSQDGPRRERPQEGPRRYSLEQATSDRAQLHTIAFDALAFLTGDFAADTFLPPGKVSDYFGFQYLRDIDSAEGGHNTSFLTRAAHNMLAALDESQRQQLVTLAREQQARIQRFAELRLPLIKAFRRNLDGDIPSGSPGLSRAAVQAWSADLYELDGLLAYDRARIMGTVLRSLDARQKAALAPLRFGDSGTWPEALEVLDRRSMPRDVHVAVMTYASEMFAWYKGSVEADTYFCPERHGMYFGGFGMKTAPAMGKKDYSISTRLTGDSGEAFLDLLDATQRSRITGLVDLQRADLAEIVKVRRSIAQELRRFLGGETADRGRVVTLSRRYGELDGHLSHLYASAFAQVGRSLTAHQRARVAALRPTEPSTRKGPFLYSSPMEVLHLGSTDFLFGLGSPRPDVQIRRLPEPPRPEGPRAAR